MKIVIVGAGKVGELLCKDLSTEGNDILLIEQDSKILENVLSNNDIMGLVGDATSYDVQMDAGVSKADIFISVTEKDEINIIASVIAKKIGAKFTIARVRNTKYSAQIDFMSKSLGIDLVINPELEAAKGIMQNIDFPDALNVESFLYGKLKLVEFAIEKQSRLVGMTIQDFKRDLFPNVLVCIIKRDNEIIIPTGRDIFREDDRIYITGVKKDILEFQNILGKHKEKIKSAFIIGAGIITHYLAKEFEKEDIKVKILELKEEKAIKFSQDLESAIVVCGDGTDQDTLKEANFKNYDSCIAITGMDETNIFISMYAKKVGIKKIVTKVNKMSFIDVLGGDTFQSVITPKKIIADCIVRIVRSLSEENNILNLYRLENNAVEAIELYVNTESEIIDVPLRELKLKKNVLIPYIVRDGKAILPKGDDTIQQGDRVIIITTENFFKDINDILDEE
ncbi:MAG: Trk system potassium transporter TrkA [Fusobacterium sp.]|nr:Trk system potassium transporter TrkA [Fusobacterium sp.]